MRQRRRLASTRRRAIDGFAIGGFAIVMPGSRLAHRRSHRRLCTRFRHHACPDGHDNKRIDATRLVQASSGARRRASSGGVMARLFIGIALQPAHEVAQLVVGGVRHLQQATRLLRRGRGALLVELLRARVERP